jgi:cysteine desulfuration protein SufE
MGRSLPPFPIEHMIPTNLVPGCQSTLYIHHSFVKNTLLFHASADALISAGLAAILVELYSNESPELILKNKPAFLQEIGILSSLTPTRANGLANLYLKMQKISLHYIKESLRNA